MGRPSSICRACLPGREGASTELLQQLSGQSGRRTAQQKLRKALPDQAPSSSTEAGQILSGFKACWGWYTLHEKKTSGVKAMLYQDPLSSTEAGHILALEWVAACRKWCMLHENGVQRREVLLQAVEPAGGSGQHCWSGQEDCASSDPLCQLPVARPGAAVCGRQQTGRPLARSSLASESPDMATSGSSCAESSWSTPSALTAC